MLTSSCICTRLRRATREVTRIYDDALREVGLNVAQFALLKHLQRLNQPSISDLAEAMGLERSTMGRNLKLLEAEGLIQLLGAEDQRMRVVRLSEQGEQRLLNAHEPWKEAQRQIGQRLGKDRQGVLMSLLDELGGV